MRFLAGFLIGNAFSFAKTQLDFPNRTDEILFMAVISIMIGIMLYTLLKNYLDTKESERKMHELMKKYESGKDQTIKGKGTSPKEK